MSDENIVFNPGEETYDQRGARPSNSGGKLIAWFMRMTGMQSEATANVVLLVLALAFFAAAIIIFFASR